MRWSHYGRFSTDMQNPTSIDDQLRICRERCDREGWTFADAYEDRAMTGTTHLRPGYQRLLNDARLGKFDVVIAEALDRISRDQEHLAHFYKHLNFNGVKLFTLSEGWVSEIHIGLGGTMGALYVKQLSEKTHRGLRGRVEAGKSGGGLTYGYDVVRTPKADGTFDVGGRKVNEAEAKIVIRILESYAAGMPPRKIAWMLNEEGVPGPRGTAWGASTINGNAERGTGILNNSLYVGKLVWNKLKYMKDPETGKRRSRVNDAADVIEKDVPDLRIVSDELWTRVKARQKQVSFTTSGAAKQPWDRRRPRYLLSGLTKCGDCGAGFVTISQTHLGCAAARNKGTCQNRLAIARDKLEATVLAGLKHHLMAPELFKEFCDAFIAEVNRGRMNATADRAAVESELAKIKRRLRQIVDAIAEGVPARSLKDELLALEAREDVLNAKLAETPAPTKVLINPGMVEIYRARVADLHNALSKPEMDKEATEAIRSLIEKIVLVPKGGRLVIDLYGEIGTMLKLASAKKGRDVLGPVFEQLVMVAGAGFEPTTFRL
jgi:site-specific DNA recombinase